MKDIINLKIFFIGAGKIAHSLAPEFKKYFEITGVFDIIKEKALSLWEKYKIPFYEHISEEVIQKSNFIIFAVSDDKIEETAEKISLFNLDFRDKMFIHLSGSKTSESLKVLSNLNAKTASFHVVQTFPNFQLFPIKNCPCAIETDDDEFYEILKSFARKFELRVFRVSKENKIFYHLSAVIISNLLCSLIRCSRMSFAKSKIDEISFENLYRALALKSFENIFAIGEAEALSGPIERGDIATIKKHLSVLMQDLDLKRAYTALSLIALDIAKEKNSNDFERLSRYEEINKILRN